MRFNTISRMTVLSAVLATFLGAAASADTIFIESTPTVVEESVVVPAPSTTVVEEHHVVVPQPAPTVIEERSVVIPQTSVVEEHIVTPTEPDVWMKRSITVGTKKPATAQSSEITLQTGPAPVFHRRIQLMKEQVDLGVARGFMSSATASSFKARLDSATAEADSVVATGTPKDLSDNLERKLNGLNIEISDSMKFATQIGSGSQFQ